MDEKNNYIVMSISDSNGKLLYKNIDFIYDYKDLNIPNAKLSYETKMNNNKAAIKLKFDSLALNVRLSTNNDSELCDNYFNMNAGEVKEIIVDPIKNLVVTCLNSNESLEIMI